MPGPDALRNLYAILLVALLAAGCGRAYWPDDDRDHAPPPGSGPDPASVSDPVPRNEPRSRYGNPDSYEVFGQTYYVKDTAEGYVERGTASWYGTKFHGRRTSSGEPYDMHAMTAAHKTLPLPTYVRVTHLENGRSIIVRVNDRGPFVDDRIIDLSYMAAQRLDMADAGTAPVEVKALTTNHEDGQPTPARFRSAAQESSGRMYVQFGAFGSRENAENLSRQLRSEGVKNVSISRARTSSGRLFRVRAGPVRNPDEAERLGRIAQQLGLANAQVVID